MDVTTIAIPDKPAMTVEVEAQKPNGKMRPETLFGMPVVKRIITTVVEVNPETAELLLAMRPAYQRPLRPSRVKSFASLIREGRFLTTHQGIAFDREGHLIDGQHRLKAVVETGVTIETNASFGLPHDTFRAMDRGAARSVADDLQADGLFTNAKEAGTFSAAARLLAMIDDGKRVTSSATGSTWTLDQAMDIFDRHAELPLAVRLAQMLPKCMPKAAFAALWALFAEKDRKAADAFASGMISGEGMSAGNPILCLREWCIASRVGGSKRAADEFVFRAIHAWNNARRGRDVAKLIGPRGENPTYPKIV